MRPSFIEENLRALREFAGRVPENIVAAVGFVDLDSDLYNACAVLSGGEVLHRYHKHYLPNYGVFDENRYFREGSGAPVVDLDGELVGVSVRGHLVHPEGRARAGTLRGQRAAQYFCLPLPQAQGRLQRADARRAGFGLRLLRRVLQPRRRPGRARLRRHSVVFDPEGALVARAAQFREDFLLVDLYPDQSLMQRLHDPRPRKENRAPPRGDNGSHPQARRRGVGRGADRAPPSPRGRSAGRVGAGPRGLLPQERLLAGGARALRRHRLLPGGRRGRRGPGPRERNRRPHAESLHLGPEQPPTPPRWPRTWA